MAKAIERAQTALANSANMGDEEAAGLEAGLKRNLAMLGVKRRRHSARRWFRDPLLRGALC